MSEFYGIPIWAIWCGVVCTAFILGVAVGWLLKGPEKWTPKPNKITSIDDKPSKVLADSIFAFVRNEGYESMLDQSTNTIYLGKKHKD